jgi:hypothetical protein
MRGMAALILLLCVAGAGLPARAEDRGPVCREPSVVDEITREVRARNYYGSVDPKLVTEQPTVDPLVVRCEVCVQSAPYNTTRFGDRPIAQCQASNFDVQILPSGYVVHALR